MGYTGEAKWCPEASSRGDAKQPRRRAGRRAGVHRRGEEPPTRSADLGRPRGCRAFAFASRGEKLYFNQEFREAVPFFISGSHN
jgi:hypothetical protein